MQDEFVYQKELDNNECICSHKQNKFKLVTLAQHSEISSMIIN